MRPRHVHECAMTVVHSVRISPGSEVLTSHVGRSHGLDRTSAPHALRWFGRTLTMPRGIDVVEEADPRRPRGTGQEGTVGDAKRHRCSGITPHGISRTLGDTAEGRRFMDFVGKAQPLTRQGLTAGLDQLGLGPHDAAYIWAVVEVE